MKTLYTTDATAHGGRNGHVRSSDGILDLDLRVPVEMGGQGEHATNPEQLFAAGYAACFEGALREVARTRKLPLTDARITARITLNITDDKRYVLGAELRGNLAGVSDEEARALMHAAHQICPYSNSMRGNVDVRLLLETDTVSDALVSSHADGGNL
jgi:osmotically inducible protein OsmC